MSNPLKVFTRDEVVEKITRADSPYRRFYFKTFNGTYVQVTQEFTLRYFRAEVRTETTYELDAIHEKNVGYGLYITPMVSEPQPEKTSGDPQS